MKNKLFLFDLDGTLLKVENAKMMSIVDTALETSGFAHLKLKSKQFSGRTDHDIFLSYLADSDLVHYPRLKTAYISELYNQLSPEDVALLDGVEEVSDWLVQAEITWGVLTGNYEPAGLKKLSCSGFKLPVPFGIYGDDFADRTELASTALHKAKLHFEKEFTADSIVIIGDTPNDIRCANQNGYISVAVATGNYSRDQLALHEPDFLLSSLSELPNMFSEY